MKYKLLFNERFKPAQYLITKDGEIIWASEPMAVWVGQTIEKFLAWVDFKNVGTWSLEGATCQPPRVTRTKSKVKIE